jgi:O-antigen/teichoic acid export membrane protein
MSIPDNTRGSRSGVAANIAWVSVGNGLALAAGLLSSILLARWLGPEARGVYALILTTSITLAAVLGQNAWHQALAFLTGKGRYSPALVAGNGLVIVLAGAFAAAVLLFLLPGSLLGSIFPDLSRDNLGLVVLLTASSLVLAVLSGLLVGLDRIPVLTTVTTARTVVSLALQFLLLGALGLGLRGALWELSISALLVIGVALLVMTRLTGIDLRPRRGLFRDAASYGAKSYPGHLGVVLLSRVDLYFVALFGGLEAAGYYAVAKGITEIVAVIEQSISQGIVPRVIDGDFHAAGAIVAGGFRLSFWVNAAVLLVGALSAGWLIPLVYGPEFAAAVPAFLLLLPGVLMLTTRTLGTFFAMQMGRPEIQSIYILGAGLVSLPVSWLLTREFGYLGAAAAFSIVAVLRGLAAMILFVRYSGIGYRELLAIRKADLIWLAGKAGPAMKKWLPKAPDPGQP